MKRKLKLTCYVLWGLVVLFYLIPIAYAMPSMDDYAVANTMLQGPMADGDGIFVSACKCFADLYIRWQGNYFSFFVLYINAGIGGLAIWWVRFLMAVNLIVFFAAIIYALKVFILTDDEDIEYGKLLGMFLLVVFCGLNRASPSENLYWLNASTIYTLPFALGFLSIANVWKYCREDKRRNLVCSIVFAILAAGGILMSTAFINISLLILNINELLGKKKLNKGALVAFISALVGGLVNALAPGHMVRARGVSSEGISIITGVKNTLYTMGRMLSFSLRKEYLMWGCITLILLFAFIPVKRQIEKSKVNVFILWIESLVVLFVTAFPVIYGYDSVETTPWRFCFIFDFISATMFLICSVYTGVSLGRIIDNKATRKAIGAVVISLVLFAANYAYAGRTEMMLPELAREFVKGDLAEFARTEETMVSEIVNSTEGDVVLNYDNPECYILKNFALKSDPTNVFNMCMAEYYGKNSIMLSK